MSVYTLTLINTFYSAFLLPSHAEYMWFGALAWGRGDMPQFTIAAVCGAVLATVVNYGFGFWIGYNGAERLRLSEQQYARTRKWVHGLLVVFLYAPMPFLSLVAAACGVFRVRLWMLLIVVTVGRIGYYLYYLNYFGKH